MCRHGTSVGSAQAVVKNFVYIEVLEAEQSQCHAPKETTRMHAAPVAMTSLTTLGLGAADISGADAAAAPSAQCLLEAAGAEAKKQKKKKKKSKEKNKKKAIFCVALHSSCYQPQLRLVSKTKSQSLTLSHR